MTMQRPVVEYRGCVDDVSAADVVAAAEAMADLSDDFVQHQMPQANIPWGWEDRERSAYAHVNLCVEYEGDWAINRALYVQYGKRAMRSYVISLNVEGEIGYIPAEAFPALRVLEEPVDLTKVDKVSWEYNLNVELGAGDVDWEESRGYEFIDESERPLGLVPVMLDCKELDEPIAPAAAVSDDPFDAIIAAMGELGDEITNDRRQLRLNQAMGLLSVIRNYRRIPDLDYFLPPAEV